MALQNCPECGQQISDKARNCPGCGAPLKKGGGGCLGCLGGCLIVIIAMVAGIYFFSGEIKDLYEKMLDQGKEKLEQIIEDGKEKLSE